MADHTCKLGRAPEETPFGDDEVSRVYLALVFADFLSLIDT